MSFGSRPERLSFQNATAATLSPSHTRTRSHNTHTQPDSFALTHHAGAKVVADVGVAARLRREVRAQRREPGAADGYREVVSGVQLREA